MTVLTREETAKYIREIRPKLSPKTIASYVSLLFPIYREEHPLITTIDTEWFENEQPRILELLKDRSDTSRASILASMCVLINDPSKTLLLRSEMISSAKVVQEDYNAGMMNEKQKDNWVDYSEIIELWKKLKIDADHYLNKQEPLTNKQTTVLTEFMLFTLSCGVYFPPRRLEWIHVKVRNYDEENDNYIDLEKKQFALNHYKTASKYGKQLIEIPDELMALITLFIEKTNPADLLLTNTHGKPYSQARAVQILNGIMGKHIGVSMLRHIYKSHFFNGVPSLREMKENATAMGHSLPISIQYIRK